MSFLESRLNRRTLGGVTMGVAATGSLAYLVSAQDATPEAEDEATAIAKINDLEDVTKINVRAMNGAFSVYTGNAQAEGWYVFNVENIGERDVSFNLALLPEGQTASDLGSMLFQYHKGEVTELPEWYSAAKYAGGVFVPVGATSTAMVYLEPGEWVMYSSHVNSKQGASTLKVHTPQELEEIFSIPAEATPVPETESYAPEGFGSTFTVSVTGSSVGADAMPVMGHNIIGVRNDGDLPADLVILHAEEVADPAALVDSAKAWMSGEETDLTLVGGMGALSPDAYGYMELDAAAGVYVAFSTLPNAEGKPQIDDGAVVVLPMA